MFIFPTVIVKVSRGLSIPHTEQAHGFIDGVRCVVLRPR